eukprot:g4885.t1.1.5e174189.1.5e1746aa g4885  g4885.t1 contig18:143832-145698(-)
MGRKRMRMRRDPHTFQDGLNQGHHSQPGVTIDGKVVNIRQISPSDEGVLYTMQIGERKKPRSSLTQKTGIFNLFSRRMPKIKAQVRTVSEANEENAPPESDTLRGVRSKGGNRHPTQFRIAKKTKYNNCLLNWIDSHDLNFCKNLAHTTDVDNHLYQPSNRLYRYINWTFHAGFAAVFMSFLFIYFFLVILFGGFLYAAGVDDPECIMSSGEHFGANPKTMFNDAFALSWTTFTTVGYGMSYTSTANDLVDSTGATKAHECAYVVLICNTEAFLGLLFAGMCAAILFGKINRVQSHAKIVFANAVCLQYEEVGVEGEVDEDDNETEENEEEEELEDVEEEKSDPDIATVPQDQDIENQVTTTDQTKVQQFTEQFNGCPVLKFQVVNEVSRGKTYWLLPSL